ncbi:hypothetical protein COCON_G00086540 [Conger conger]|uniref:Transducer of regulated CREB activity middle domain-containing protein n=1 Tax=Conger conger TaxID=82655 RepID=A0A9Q1DK82_CONCO|nr:hypothetical protein COCON_G00086540 [Conger conger]
MYLSPSPETSWRRTNSDSALHQSTLNPTSQDGLTGGSQELQPKRVLLLTVPGGGGVGSEADEDGQQQNVTSRPCKVPGINIFPSLDQETNTLIPANHNTGGSLPDLTSIQFPPPLPTPLDPEDTATCPTLSATPTHLGLTSINPGIHPQPHPGLHPQLHPGGHDGPHRRPRQPAQHPAAGIQYPRQHPQHPPHSEGRDPAQPVEGAERCSVDGRQLRRPRPVPIGRAEDGPPDPGRAADGPRAGPG